MGSLRRVIVVGQAVDLSSGTLIVTAIEIWERGTILHAAEQLPEFLPPGEAIPVTRPLWRLSDDVGTLYVGCGGGSSGSQAQRRTTQEWESAVPSNASVLYVVGPGMPEDEPIHVALT